MAVSSSYPMNNQPTLSALLNFSNKTRWYWEAVQKRFDEEGWDLPESASAPDAAALNFRKKMAALVEKNGRRLAPRPAERLALTEYTENVRTVFPEITYGIWHEPGAFRRRQPLAKSTPLAPSSRSGGSCEDAGTAEFFNSWIKLGRFVLRGMRKRTSRRESLQRGDEVATARHLHQTATHAGA